MKERVGFDCIINGIPVHAEYSYCNVEDIFLPLLRKLTSLQKKLQRRVVVFLAAPPAAGKSTLAEFLQQLSETVEGLTPLQALGMDGFHRYQEYLIRHATIRNGVEIPMVRVKGAPETFDTDKLLDAVKAVRSGEICAWPVYDRVIHNPVENALTVNRDIVLIEGNYLLLDDSNWKELSDYSDYTVSITADPLMLKDRLISRHILSGKSAADSESFVESSDLINANLCISNMLPADLQLRLCIDGSYKIS